MARNSRPIKRRWTCQAISMRLWSRWSAASWARARPQVPFLPPSFNLIYLLFYNVLFGATDMRRREFITFLASAVAARPLNAQAPDRMRYIAWLGLGHAGTPSPYLDSLRTGLRELGWIEGRNLKIVAFWATGREDMEGVAREVLASDPDVIVTQELMAIAMWNL